MTPIKDFRRTILCYFSFSQRLWFSCFVVRWSVYSSRLKELHRRWVWELRTHMKKKKDAVMRWIIYKRNKYLDAFTENSNKNELSVPSLYIGQVMAMKLSGMFSYGWNQIWTSKLSAVKRIAVWSLRKCRPLEVATGAWCPHSRSNHTQCIEIRKAPWVLDCNLVGMATVVNTVMCLQYKVLGETDL